VGDRGYRVQDVITLLRHADMSASYKPTLLAAIVRCERQGLIEGDHLSLDAIAEQYLELYWSQVVVFRLRHSARDTAPPVILKKIQTASDRSHTRKLSQLDPGQRSAVIKAIAQVIPINVLTCISQK
jgi:hypothetical protein